MKKVLLPLAFLGMTMGATTMAAADDTQWHHGKDSQSLCVVNDNIKDVLVFILDAENCKVEDVVEVDGHHHKHIKVCNRKPFKVSVCFAKGRSETGGPSRDCDGEKVFCNFTDGSPRLVTVESGRWNPDNGNSKPVIVCVGGKKPS